ncbi:hypothetical protein PPL_07404 [Heterostelium album PN500]|uniref:Uncharacterized protein n=1 Tax=Heterostelium pallidum (strain ATCC 26659 / Pp 5 / PN500) TaxID=670386 RepID=D3BFV3_HETP5|nr:hypothetical protein PPL_07404 [Heterostelium album PN500]EFA79713.1 hypothetical protein PPL_07404 [Heterostelium album PN500]|eukprot:XP_020431834.1 hypothetical protein PPL_07404 [Heterostelium album PN500]
MEYLIYSKLLKNSKNDELFWPKESKKPTTESIKYSPPSIKSFYNTADLINDIGFPNKQESGSILR